MKVYNSGGQLIETVTFLYDGNGNNYQKARATTTTYTYDLENRLTQVALGGSTQATYAYFSDGSRIQRTASGTPTYFLYDFRDFNGFNDILEEYECHRSINWRLKFSQRPAFITGMLDGTLRGRTMDLTYISMEKKDRVAIAWLNKPKANTYDADLMRDLNTMIDDVRFDDDVDVCVIASKLDGVWSAGADINLLASSTPDYKAMFCLNCQETLNKMESTPKLFIAAIDGHCVGGGLEIAMATDLRLASDGAWRIGLPEVTLGVLPGTGGTQRLPRLIGKSRAIDLMATGRMITPKEALDWGLLNRVFPRAKFWEETMAFAKGLAYPQHAARAVGFIKRSVTEGVEMPMYEGFALERELQNRLFAMADAKEGFRAFLEKRKPAFQGK